MHFRHGGPSPFLPPPLYSFLLPLTIPSPFNPSSRAGECYNFPQRVWTEPDHQRYILVHFEVKVKHFRVLGTDVLYCLC